MLQPARLKFRKVQKGRIRGYAARGVSLAYGDLGIQATEFGLVTNRHIEAGRMAMARCMKKGGKIFVRIFPDKPITKKPAETRMGKGKGNVEGWGAVVQKGRVLFEIEGIEEEIARQALKLAADKMPVKTQVITREKFK